MIGDVEPPAASEKTTVHNFPTVYSQEITGVPVGEAPGADLMSEDDRFVAIAEFASVELHQPTIFHTIAKRDAITFLMVSRPVSARGTQSWDFPPILLCQDYINELLSKLYAEDATGASAYLRSGRWGKLQTIVIQSRCLQTLNELRRHIVMETYQGYAFDTFPRDVVVAKPDVSILLRGSMKTFQTEIIPKVLFNRNKDIIAGSLRVLSTKFFSANDYSHKGESKENWRTISLKGDEQFMRCLRFIPESRPFLLGYDAVQIRGGLRPQEPSHPHFQVGAKRPWADIGPAPTPLLPDRTESSFGASSDSTSSETPRGHGKRGRPFRGGSRSRGRGRYPRKS